LEGGQSVLPDSKLHRHGQKNSVDAIEALSDLFTGRAFIPVFNSSRLSHAMIRDKARRVPTHVRKLTTDTPPAHLLNVLSSDILRPFERGSRRSLTGCARVSFSRSRHTDLNARKRADSNRRGHDDETFNECLTAQSLQDGSDSLPKPYQRFRSLNSHSQFPSPSAPRDSSAHPHPDVHNHVRQPSHHPLKVKSHLHPLPNLTSTTPCP